jgi:hypothetical protein
MIAAAAEDPQESYEQHLGCVLTTIFMGYG